MILSLNFYPEILHTSEPDLVAGAVSPLIFGPTVGCVCVCVGGVTHSFEPRLSGDGRNDGV